MKWGVLQFDLHSFDKKTYFKGITAGLDQRSNGAPKLESRKGTMLEIHLRLQI
jgi:hypothetical protein